MPQVRAPLPAPGRGCYAVRGGHESDEPTTGPARPRSAARATPPVRASRVPRGGRGPGDVAARLAAGLGLQHVHGSALFQLTPSAWLNARIAASMNFTEGPAVLSRFPIARREVLKLPRCTGVLDPRVLVYADVVTPAGVMPVFSTHFSGQSCESEAVAHLAEARRGEPPRI